MRSVQDVVLDDHNRQHKVLLMSFNERFNAAKSYLSKVPPSFRKLLCRELSTEALALNDLRSRDFYGY